MKTCIIIGAAGFIGSAILNEARSRGYGVIAVIRDNYESMKGASADILINASGNSKKFVDEREPQRGFDMTVGSVMRILHDFKFGYFIQLSSGAIYPDEGDPSKNLETAILHPAEMTNYGFHKWLAEQIARHYAPDRLILRLGGFVGPGLKKNAIFDLLAGRDLFVHPDSEFQYMDTRDLAKALFKLTENAGGGETLLNLSALGAISIRHAAELAGRRLPADSFEQPVTRAELNVEHASRLLDLPSTMESVSKFIREVGSGKIRLE